ncbi:MAG: DNA alkylation repair protein [Promethearchaeota archaeon]
MPIKEIFNDLVTNNNTDQLFELIQNTKESIPQSQRTGKGIVWTLRNIRQLVIQAKVPLNVKKQSLDILIVNEHWQIRHFAPLVATNCSIEERNPIPYLSVIKSAATDLHFAVREAAQMTMRELLQVFPSEILQLYDKDWIVSPNENVRRCVSESLRPVLVGGKNWIRDEPEESIKRLKRLNRDPSLYVRKSVGNNLADISKRHPELVLAILREWLDENNYNKWTLFIARKACRRVFKSHSAEVNELLRGESIIK